ncbi:hypothetical protein CLTEP_25050 [Clostridium tepidiprofundi DSM 19306]|uniref:DUF5348 domain-containing protein n=1 Tax=Clostridium tepidiprofundi DSM 19306 TaxID=1121338 RepID=A0A151ASX2_9CLOT|nr:DUF5348 domain-containing protein [Clostridium tepidiprofundi]KYH30739.1 hypothetical protein CLTEP_25050 [Clostridium tepidiprofundi DSM 19306]
MNKKYIKAKLTTEKTLGMLNNIRKIASVYEFEDKQVYKALENVIESIEDFINEIEYYSKSAEVGKLYINSNGRYELNSKELYSGYPIEVYNEEYGEWNAGRIEYSNKYGGYYFYNCDEEHFALNDGMKARIRG